MKIKFAAILSIEAVLEAAKNDPDALQYCPEESKTEAVCLEAAKNDPYALQYCLVKELFIKIAGMLNIEVEV